MELHSSLFNQESLPFLYMYVPSPILYSLSLYYFSLKEEFHLFILTFYKYLTPRQDVHAIFCYHLYNRNVFLK